MSRAVDLWEWYTGIPSGKCEKCCKSLVYAGTQILTKYKDKIYHVECLLDHLVEKDNNGNQGTVVYSSGWHSP